MTTYLNKVDAQSAIVEFLSPRFSKGWNPPIAEMLGCSTYRDVDYAHIMCIGSPILRFYFAANIVKWFTSHGFSVISGNAGTPFGSENKTIDCFVRDITADTIFRITSTAYGLDATPPAYIFAVSDDQNPIAMFSGFEQALISALEQNQHNKKYKLAQIRPKSSQTQTQTVSGVKTYFIDIDTQSTTPTNYQTIEFSQVISTIVNFARGERTPTLQLETRFVDSFINIAPKKKPTYVALNKSGSIRTKIGKSTSLSDIFITQGPISTVFFQTVCSTVGKILTGKSTIAPNILKQRQQTEADIIRRLSNKARGLSKLLSWLEHPNRDPSAPEETLYYTVPKTLCPNPADPDTYWSNTDVLKGLTSEVQCLIANFCNVVSILYGMREFYIVDFTNLTVFTDPTNTKNEGVRVPTPFEWEALRLGVLLSATTKKEDILHRTYTEGEPTSDAFQPLNSFEYKSSQPLGINKTPWAAEFSIQQGFPNHVGLFDTEHIINVYLMTHICNVKSLDPDERKSKVFGVVDMFNKQGVVDTLDLLPLKGVKSPYEYDASLSIRNPNQLHPALYYRRGSSNYTTSFGSNINPTKIPPIKPTTFDYVNNLFAQTGLFLMYEQSSSR